MNDEIKPGALAIESIREKVRALIRPTPLDFFKAAAESRRGLQAEEARHYARLMDIRDKGRAAATRLTVLTRDPDAAAPERYDSYVRKQKRGK
jgi:hypothetical protein